MRQGRRITIHAFGFGLAFVSLLAASLAGTGPDSSAEARKTAQVSHGIPGCLKIDLSKLDVRLHDDFVRVVRAVARAHGVLVYYVLPSEDWNRTTGAPSAQGNMFASDLGIGYDPSSWDAEHAESSLRSLAVSPHQAENGKSFPAMVAHEMGHVILAQRFGLELDQPDNQVRLRVEEYRRTQGESAIREELGGYAWTGSPGRVDQAWLETFAEAFAAFTMDPRSLREATRTMVTDVLRLGPVEKAVSNQGGTDALSG